MGLGELLRNIFFDWNVFSLEGKKTAKGEAFVAGLPKDSKAGEDDADDDEEEEDDDAEEEPDEEEEEEEDDDAEEEPDEEQKEEKGDGDSAEAERGDEGEGDDEPADGDVEVKDGEVCEAEEDDKGGEDGDEGKASSSGLLALDGSKRAPKKNAPEPKKEQEPVIEEVKELGAAFTAWVKKAVEMLGSSKKEPFDFKKWVNEGQAILLCVVEQTAGQKVEELTGKAKKAATSQLRAAVSQATSAVKRAADGGDVTTAKLDDALVIVERKLDGAKNKLKGFDAHNMVAPLRDALKMLEDKLDKSKKASPIYLLDNACAGLQVIG